jgi:hypothetical protein
LKRLRTYSVGEVAETLCIHPHTVRLWIAAGLATVDRHRPTLIRGEDVQQFLAARRARRRRTCPPGTIFCVKCREPRRPAGDMAELREISTNTGDLQAICPVCLSMMHRRVNLGAMAGVWSGITVTTTHPEKRIEETA